MVRERRLLLVWGRVWGWNFFSLLGLSDFLLLDGANWMCTHLLACPRRGVDRVATTHKTNQPTNKPTRVPSFYPYTTSNNSNSSSNTIQNNGTKIIVVRIVALSHYIYIKVQGLGSCWAETPSLVESDFPEPRQSATGTPALSGLGRFMEFRVVCFVPSRFSAARDAVCLHRGFKSPWVRLTLNPFQKIENYACWYAACKLRIHNERPRPTGLSRIPTGTMKQAGVPKLGVRGYYRGRIGL